MNKATKQALKDSIEHWERMMRDPDCGDRLYRDECALCNLFWNPAEACPRCPIGAHTGLGQCMGTPYGQARDALGVYLCAKTYGEANLAPLRRAWRESAQEEIDFLRSLLEPQGKDADDETEIS